MQKFLKWSRVFTVCTLFCSLSLVFDRALATSIKAPNLSDPALDFILVRSAVACEPVCVEWLSAEGRIDAASPYKLEAAIRSLKGRKLPIILNSVGGDVNAAMSMGRIIRKAGLPVYIGGTMLSGCTKENWRCFRSEKVKSVPIGVAYALGAFCLSACPLVLAAGVDRRASDWSPVGVHQITTGMEKFRVEYQMTYRVVNGRKKIVSQREVGRQFLGVNYTAKMSSKLKKQLNSYWREMGVSRKVTELMLTAAPDDMHIILPPDLRTLKLLNAEGGVIELLRKDFCTAQPVSTFCVNSSDL